jgi:hypothetical protein
VLEIIQEENFTSKVNFQMLLSFFLSLLLAFSLQVKKVELELQVEPNLGLVEIV